MTISADQLREILQGMDFQGIFRRVESYELRDAAGNVAEGVEIYPLPGGRRRVEHRFVTRPFAGQPRTAVKWYEAEPGA